MIVYSMSEDERVIREALAEVLSGPGDSWNHFRLNREISPSRMQSIFESLDALRAENARLQAGTRQTPLSWAVSRWNAEVKFRPLINVNRRTLDDTWRQVVRHFGGDPDILLGPSHDALLAASQETGNG